MTGPQGHDGKQQETGLIKRFPIRSSRDDKYCTMTDSSSPMIYANLH